MAPTSSHLQEIASKLLADCSLRNAGCILRTIMWHVSRVPLLHRRDAGATND